MMNESKKENTASFKGQDDAFEFLVRQSQNLLLKEKWRRELELSGDVEYSGSLNSHNDFIVKIIGILAILIVLMGLFYWFHVNRNSLDSMTNRMIEDSYFAKVNDLNVRGVEDLHGDKLLVELQDEIDISIEQNDFNATVGLFLTKEKQTQLSIEDKFFYAVAISKSENGDFYKAIRMLEQVELQNDKFQNESLWLQGLLYIKIDNVNNARIVLQRLLQKSDYQSENVRLLLDQIINRQKRLLN